MKSSILLLSAALCAAVHADAVKDREGAVRSDKAVMEKDARWLYNDTAAAFTAAEKSGKPLLVVLRCVPCLACMGLDAQVIEDASLAPLLDQFVCLRVINANALNLSRFQFDYDLSLTAMIFHADGTVIGRFGSWQHQKNKDDRATDGFRAALTAALGIHKNYPANKATLAGKQGGDVRFMTPVAIPLLAGRYNKDLDWQGKVVQSCVHCHQIGDALRATLREERKPMPDQLIYPFPAPETIGLTLAPDQAARVTAVAAGSPAEKAGFKPGDDIASLNSQPLISSSDLSWVLHQTPATASLTASVKRGEAPVSLTISLPDGWRAQSDISRRVGTWDMRGMATGGLVLEDLPDADRGALNLKNDQLALRVKFVGQYNKHAAAKNAGWQQGDVLVEIDNLTARMSEGALIGHLLKNHQAGEKLTASVLRGGKKIPLTLPMQ
jgi:serine protease Do